VRDQNRYPLQELELRRGLHHQWIVAQNVQLLGIEPAAKRDQKLNIKALACTESAREAIEVLRDTAVNEL